MSNFSNKIKLYPTVTPKKTLRGESMLEHPSARLLAPSVESKKQSPVNYQKLNWNNRVEILRFILTLDDNTLNQRFNYGRKIASIFAHYNNVSFKSAKFFAASKGSLIALAELYAEDDNWISAELILTVLPEHSCDQIYSELAHLAIMDLARRETETLTLCHRAYVQILYRYFESYDILHRDEDFIRLAL